MAQKIQVLIMDDLDASPITPEDQEAGGGTVQFGLDGVAYEIDLKSKKAAELRKCLAKYVDAARKVTGAPPAKRGGRGSGGGGKTAAKPGEPSTSEIREWAKGQGYEVKDRGRVPVELRDKYHAATRG